MGTHVTTGDSPATGTLSVGARRERDRLEMRRAILDAARRLFIARGYGNVPVRDIAAEIGYSPTTIYRQFESKGDVFYVLAEEGFRLLVDWDSQSPRRDDAGPLERLVQYMWGYYEFSRAYPEYFYLMFLDPSAPALDFRRDRFHFATSLGEKFDRLFDEALSAGDIPPSVDRDAVRQAIMACLHGGAAMHVCGAWIPDSEVDDAARRGIGMIVAAIRDRETADLAERLWLPNPVNRTQARRRA